ncbi:MAG: hypothetical protein IBX45_02705 [Campylobacterales bacterium]|nr:hypothetical protein [Campylobacterales bacterium]
MKNHKVVDMKITYEPDNMTADQVKELEDKIAEFIEFIKNNEFTKILAKRHNVAVDIMIDEYGIEID